LADSEWARESSTPSPPEQRAGGWRGPVAGVGVVGGVETMDSGTFLESLFGVCDMWVAGECSSPSVYGSFIKEMMNLLFRYPPTPAVSQRRFLVHTPPLTPRAPDCRYDNETGWAWQDPHSDVYHSRPRLCQAWRGIRRQLRLKHTSIKGLFATEGDGSTAVGYREFRQGLVKAGLRPIPPEWLIKALPPHPSTRTPPTLATLWRQLTPTHPRRLQDLFSTIDPDQPGSLSLQALARRLYVHIW